jgi:RNA polymerase sigma factor (sigma-70 family)
MAGFAQRSRPIRQLFRPLDDSDLQRLDDDRLIDYMRRARAAGHPSAGTALWMLVQGYWPNIERRVWLKVPPQHAEDLAGDIVVTAITSSFDGTSVGEFRSWLNTITSREIADFYRRGPGRIKTAAAEGVERAAAPETGAVEMLDTVERVLATLRADHRAIVTTVLFEDRSAAEAARAVGTSEANVHQIVSRFRRALRGELEAGGDTGSG